MKPCLGIITFALLACAPSCYAASFDCLKAASRTEQIICRDNKLSELDEALTHVYQERLSALKDTRFLREQQRTWLLEVRNRCTTATCLIAVYQKRLAQLSVAPTFPSDICAESDRGTLGDGYCLGSKVDANEQLLSGLVDVLVFSRGLNPAQETAFGKKQADWRKDLRCHCEAKAFGYNTGSGNVIYGCEISELEKRIGEIKKIIEGAPLDYGGEAPRTCKGINDAKEATPEYQLIAAVEQNDIQKVATILDTKIDIRAMDIWEHGDPVYFAAKNGNEKILHLLLKHGASPNGTGRVSPLFAALEHCHKEAVRELVNYGIQSSEAEALWKKQCPGNLN